MSLWLISEMTLINELVKCTAFPSVVGAILCCFCFLRFVIVWRILKFGQIFIDFLEWYVYSKYEPIRQHERQPLKM